MSARLIRDRPAVSLAAASTRSRSAGVSASRTTVRASMIAPSTTARSALGPAAAAAKAGWWTVAPPASMPTTGWMPGITCVTLPMSVLPKGSPASTSAGTGSRPSRRISSRNTSASHGSGASSAYGGAASSISYSQPVASAPAAKQANILPSSSRSDSDVDRPHRVLQRRVPGDDVGRLAAVGDDAVDQLSGRQLLPQQPDGHLRDGHRVGGVDAQIRRDGGVRFAAAVVHGHLGQRQRARRGDVDRPGMQHHRRRDVVEHPGLEHQRLTAAGLLGGSAQQRHRQPEFVGHLGQRQRGTHRRRRDDVVAAGVTDPGQRVVLGAHPDHQRSAAEVGAKRGVQAAGAAVISKPRSATSAWVLAQLRCSANASSGSAWMAWDSSTRSPPRRRTSPRRCPT